MKTKVCSKCVTPKPLSDFVKNKDARDGLRAWCRKCCSEYAKTYARNLPPKRQHLSPEEYRAKIPLWARKTDLKRYYNLTLEQYQAMVEAQGGVCAICGKPETWENQYGQCNLSVEHDHVTGRVRALVCNRCNSLVSLLENHPHVPAAPAY